MDSQHPAPVPEDGAEKFVRRSWQKRRKGETYAFAIVLDGRAVGVCSLHRVERKNRYVELSYWLGKPFWGRGIITQAAKLIVRYGFDELRLRRIGAMTFGENKASQAVLKKIVFTREGVQRDRHYKFNKFYDEVVFGLVKK